MAFYHPVGYLASLRTTIYKVFQLERADVGSTVWPCGFGDFCEVCCLLFSH